MSLRIVFISYSSLHTSCHVETNHWTLRSFWQRFMKHDSWLTGFGWAAHKLSGNVCVSTPGLVLVHSTVLFLKPLPHFREHYQMKEVVLMHKKNYLQAKYRKFREHIQSSPCSNSRSIPLRQFSLCTPFRGQWRTLLCQKWHQRGRKLDPICGIELLAVLKKKFNSDRRHNKTWTEKKTQQCSLGAF